MADTSWLSTPISDEIGMALAPKDEEQRYSGASAALRAALGLVGASSSNSSGWSFGYMKSVAGYKFYLDDVLLPVTPTSLKIKIKNQNKTLNLINEGEINLLKQAGLTSISFSALLPFAKNYPFNHYRSISEYQAPYYFLSKLEQLKNSRKPFTFRVVRAGPGIGRIMFNDNSVFSVSLEDYTVTEDAAQYGQDTMVSISLLQYRAYGSKILTVNTETGTATATETRDTSTKAAVKEYTIIQGDTLTKIAQKTLNDGSRWKEIYTLNKEAIEADAKKHGVASSSNGKQIYPGLTLKIPG